MLYTWNSCENYVLTCLVAGRHCLLLPQNVLDILQVDLPAASTLLLLHLETVSLRYTSLSALRCHVSASHFHVSALRFHASEFQFATQTSADWNVDAAPFPTIDNKLNYC